VIEVDVTAFLNELGEGDVDGFASIEEMRRWWENLHERGVADWYGAYVDAPDDSLTEATSIAPRLWANVLSDLEFADVDLGDLTARCSFDIRNDFLWGVSTLEIGSKYLISMSGGVPRQFYALAKALAIQTGPSPMPPTIIGRYLQASWATLVLMGQFSVPASLVTRGVETEFVEQVISIAERFVVLHEIGHLALGHAKCENNLEVETEADAFAFGCLYRRLSAQAPQSGWGHLVLAYAAWIACCSADLRGATTFATPKPVELGQRWLTVTEPLLPRLLARDLRASTRLLYGRGRELFEFPLRPRSWQTELSVALDDPDRFKPTIAGPGALINFHAIDTYCALSHGPSVLLVSMLGQECEQPGSVQLARGSAAFSDLLTPAGLVPNDLLASNTIAGARHIVDAVLPRIGGVSGQSRVSDVVWLWQADEELFPLLGPTAVSLLRNPNEIPLYQEIAALWR